MWYTSQQLVEGKSLSCVMNLLLSVLVQAALSFSVAVVAGESHQFCIIGAGPGGLQLGYYLQRSGRDYVIFERNDTAGSFYLHYPRHRTLISINKRFTGSSNHEFNLRHDWNSLLSHDRTLELKHYTKDYFPHADVYVRYLSDYASKLDLNIQYRTEIVNVEKYEHFELLDTNGSVYICNVVIVSTGLWVPNVPVFEGVDFTEGYEDVSIDPKDFEDQTVMIIGKGNAGFETAQNLVGAAAYIHITGRSPVRQAYQTHYVGDLRAINNQLVDTYQLKSLDGYIDASFGEGFDSFNITKAVGGGLRLVQSGGTDADTEWDNIPDPVYDRVIRCAGFKFDFSIFGDTTRQGIAYKSKYPTMTAGFQSTQTPDLYFAGAASHAVDYRRSAGGFIHGYRYNCRALYKHLEWRYNGVQWPSLTIDAVDLTDHIIKRVNEASGLYQMFGVLADVALIREDNTAVYLEDVPIGSLPYGEDYTGHVWGSYILINFEYGPNFSGPGKDTLSGAVIQDPKRANESNFLHPVLYYFEDTSSIWVDEHSGRIFGAKSIFHLVEDLLTHWYARKSHIIPTRWFVEDIYQQDLRHFTPETCFKFMFNYGNHLPLSCQRQLYKST